MLLHLNRYDQIIKIEIRGILTISKMSYPPFKVALNCVSVVYGIFTICLYLGWLVNFFIQCLKTFKMYRTCKGTPNLHPIYRDVQYLSQRRKLYNLETHCVKYLLIFLCILFELIALFWILLCAVFNSGYTKSNIRSTEIKLVFPNCTGHSNLNEFYFHPFSIIMYNTQIMIYMSLFTLLSILTRYLSARYLNHPFKKTLAKYLTWLGFQILMIAVCSSIYTVIAVYLIFPVLSLVNWLVLLRDIRILSRVLRSNLRELELFSNNRVLYQQNVYGFRLFRIFQKCLLFSLFCLVLSFIIFSCNFILITIYHSSCLLNKLYGTDFNTNKITLHDNTGVERYLQLFFTCIFFLHSISSSFPLLTITFLPLIKACVKRYKSRHFVYRYNYGNIESAKRLI